MRPFLQSPQRHGALAALLLFAGMLPARADIDLPSVPPPQPKPLTAQVFKGESVEIPLEGVSRSGFQVQFLIRKQPEMGSLSEPVTTGRTTATIVYTHDAAAGLGVDRFRYAAQTSNTGVSTPAEVIVRVVERPPMFVAPTQVDFPPTAVGEVSHRELEIRNDGGGRISGTIEVPQPWQVVTGGEPYDLGPRESRAVVLVFTPEHGADFSGNIEFSHAEGARTAVYGRGYEPISVVPREIRIESEGRGEVRQGAFLVRNESDADRELRIEAPEDLVVEDSVMVPAKSEVEVALHTRTGFLDPISGSLRLTGETVDLTVPLEVAAAPVRLVADATEIAFGELGSGRTGRRKLAIRNAGGTPADLRASLPEGLELNPPPAVERLEPGESREFEVAFVRLAPGEAEGLLVLEASASRLEIPFSAEIRSDAGPEPDGSGEQPAAPMRPRVDLADIPPVSQIGVARQTQNELDLVWKKTSPNVAKYVIFQRSIAFNDKGQAVFRFEPLEKAKVRFVREEARATVSGLKPGEMVTIQIVGFDSAGRESVASPPFSLATKPARPLRIPWTGLGLAVLAGAVVVIVLERRRRRREAMRETWTP